MSRPDPTTVTPIEVLDGMEEMVHNEMVQRIGYISLRTYKPELAEAGAICLGHMACAVGSLWLAGGVELSWSGGLAFLPGTSHTYNMRVDWLRVNGYEGIITAYEALETAAAEYVEREGLTIQDTWEDYGALEGLFESYDDEQDEPLIEPHQLVDVIERARELLS
jgi:hypothetical protein